MSVGSVLWDKENIWQAFSCVSLRFERHVGMLSLTVPIRFVTKFKKGVNCQAARQRAEPSSKGGLCVRADAT